MTAIRIAATIVGTYGAVLALIYFLQTSIIFPGGGRALLLSELPENAERLSLATSSGATLAGLSLSADPIEAAGTVIIGFGGNASNADGTAIFLASVFPEHDVVVFHYRGYGASSGKISAAAILEDSLKIYDFIQARYPAGNIISIGISIGSGPATHIARHRKITGMLLITPFDSLKAVAKSRLFWLPVSLLLRHHMDPVEEIRVVDVPVAVIAAGKDEVIPAARTRALREAVPNLIFETTIENAGHNDIYNRSALREAMRTSVAAMLSTGDIE